MRIAILVLSLVVGVLVILIVFLLLNIKAIAKKETKTKIELYETISKVANKHETIFLGDSITELFRIHEIFSVGKLHNRGISFDTTDGVLKRLESNVLVMNPKKIFFMVGTNDLGLKKSPMYVIANLKKIIDMILITLPNVELYFWSLLPVNNKISTLAKFTVGRRKNKDIDLINETIKNYIESKNQIFIDVNSSFKENGVLKKEYTYEGLHLTYEGYLHIAPFFAKYLD